MYSSKEIAEFLKRFRINEDTTPLIVIKIGSNPDEVLEDMSKAVDEIQISFSKLDQEKGMIGLYQLQA
ncbi:hypothetical protein BCR41DRAFT_395791 [Lobosporangium transversale]|uniref:EKC/KEOPS complex subunit CGI121 n=1 Tax=Lobosporangium transversale TaxID=64571 RepID=A0A1Y2GP82_9FUNG|nr:hypothetical protein BCR41DRAFT_395791 [Lobosporangium transversale]ORZ17510.1 hypothetical protein BCR41DRAFT_395791 [Lobosporangium transversale]|eukprot:XP_021881897.1 hypothetical protein BCR41DRAFT_395791 [Lobosporangium transversale]